MSEPFSAKFALVLKALTLTRSQVAAELGIDKSLVGRWATGAARPSAHNLSRLTTLVAARGGRFTTLDWERDLAAIATALGVGPAAAAPAALPLPLLAQIVPETARRGPAYEGFFRSTRPFFDVPGQFIHDHVMMRLADNGLLSWTQGTGGVFVEGWMMALGSQLFVVGTETTSQSLVFGVGNGVNALKAARYEGIITHCALDAGRTPIAFAFVADRIADLSGDRAADDAFFADLAARPAVAPAGSVDPDLAAHLVRDTGPAALAGGGDWLLALPLARSLSRGVIPD